MRRDKENGFRNAASKSLARICVARDSWIGRYKSGMRELYLEDFAVGQRFISATHALDAEQIKAFASRFDPQPFHTDEVAAKDSFFHGLAASGWHTASVTMSLLVKSGMPIAGGLIGAGCECPGRAPPGRAMCCRWKAKCWR